VFTPYRNAHIKKLNDFYVKPYPVDAYRHHYAVASDEIAQQYALRELAQMGFTRTNLQSMKLPTGMSGGKALLEDFLERISYYEEARNFPAVKGPSYLSVHLRFGTVSIRYLARVAWQTGNAGATTWLNELIWRDFYFQILYHRPDLAEGKAYKAEYEALYFPNNPAHYLAWCEGKTGYPLVDAAMRQLNQTGYMHNRLRMVAASFLVKDLLVDWRWGERYFAEHLIDFDFSANNGGWQWAASTGCDAQPYFRIFNPVSQSEKFDPQGKFIRKYVPELAKCSDKEIHAPWTISSFRQQLIALEIGRDYPYPIVDHTVQRALALDLYKFAKI
jgi:deoxyribodipyrimidine photo-lyase